ncbi:MAG: AEC family transporter [Candidatus Bipolaricaulota bacterium]
MFLLDVVVPVVLVAAIGFTLTRFAKIDPQPLTQLSFYLLVPALIFQSIQNPAISEAAFLDIAVFVGIVHGVLFLLAVLAGRAARWDADTRAAATLSFSFCNCGNYGLPVLLFAFGEVGFALGVVYSVAHQAFQIAVGVPYASWRKGMTGRALARTVFAVPWLYALVLAGAVRFTGLRVPTYVARPIDFVADAAIPLQLLLLGMSLAGERERGVLRLAAPISLAKLAVPPVLAWAAATALGYDGLLRAVLILEASTPTAVNALILSRQFGRRPELTASVILLTTLGAVGLTSLLLWILA